MKPHLPKILLTAVLATSIALPAHAVEAPEGYTTTYLNSPGSLENYSSLTAEDYMAFILQSSQEITPTSADYWTNSTPLISGGNVFFGSDNSDSPVALSFKDGNGSAFFRQSSLTFDTLSNLTFSTNAILKLYYYKSALTITNVIDGQSGTIDVLFENGKSSSSSSYAYGGAIDGSKVIISNNGDVTFRGNITEAYTSYTAYSHGGAIYASGGLTISNNNDVTFCGNSAYSSDTDSVPIAYSHGGAICASGGLTISNNNNVIFSRNSASSYTPAGAVSCSADGGAIYAAGDLNISNNNNVIFSGNSAYVSSNWLSSYGGAISASGDLTISNNNNVIFSGNSAAYSLANSDDDEVDAATHGGAIYVRSIHDNVSLHIQGNDSVLFEKNYINSNGSYKLESICIESTHGSVNMILSAAASKSIEFRDAIYIGSGNIFNLNADYGTIKQQGDIIFTGASTETDLLAVKGSAGSVKEIQASRTSEVYTMTNLYGGRLRIENGAIYKGKGITVAEGANATLMLKDGTLSHAGYDITISSGSVLSAVGTNSLTASVLTIQDGGMMQLALGMAQVDGAAVLTTTGSLNMGNISFDLTGTEYLAAGEYKLLNRTEGVDYDISGWTLNGATSDQLRWQNGTLYYIGGHDWNHGVTDDDDISDLGEILGNLIINGGDITLDDVVNAIQDAVDAGFGHGQGHIVINRGGIHISGAGDLDGHIIFNGDLKDIRKLFIEKDITNIKIELSGSSEAENIVDVGGEYTVEIDSLAGEGSMSKTGEGEMVVHGHGHKVGGMLDVQEGTLTFTAGNETAGEPTGTETEVNELVVGNKKDKEAKVKVEKDTKVKGNKMQVDGQHAVVTNNGTMEFTGEVKVKKGHLENNGSISKVTLEGGTVSGSGEFAGLEMLGGELVVGNSPGLQTYTDSATFTEGSIIFSMADTDTAATSGTAGWDSSAYSTIDMDGNALMLGENVNIVLELGGAALESLVAEVNATLEFSLKLIQNIDSASLTMGAEGFAMLLDNTRILITEDSEGLTAATLHLAGLDITGMLSNAAYRYEGSTLVFSGVVTNNGTLTVPEPATATLSLLALAGLCARRRRK